MEQQSRYSVTLKKEALCPIETLISTCKSTRRYNPGDHHGLVHLRENLISQNSECFRERKRTAFTYLLSGLLRCMCCRASVAECLPGNTAQCCALLCKRQPPSQGGHSSTNHVETRREVLLLEKVHTCETRERSDRRNHQRAVRCHALPAGTATRRGPTWTLHRT
jgi:hypothetical protein